ncbi:MAG TPA: BPSS1780 family membrane protein [Thiolinea sp.]|nr:BPSS1780 family membrane protein [Thiolinea sp.]
MANLRVVGAGDSVNWYKGGWEIFKSNIANWVLMTLILLVLMAVAIFIPFVGPIALYLVLPVLLGGMFYSAQKLDQGQTADIMDLFALFKDQQRLTPLIILGLIFLVVGFLSSMIVGGMMVASMSTMAPGQMSVMPSFGFGVILLSLLISVLSLMLFMFAVPLIVFKNMSTIDAIKNSFTANLKNFPAFIIFVVIYLVLAIIAAIPFGLGFLVLAPVMVAATYVAYKNIFA